MVDADANHQKLHAILVRLHSSERLAKYLRDTVAPVGLRIDAVINRLITSIKAGGVI